MKIYVAVLEALKKKNDRMKFNYHQNWWFLKFHPLTYFFEFFINVTPVYDQTQGSEFSVLSFS
jgi:hypothetical protein